MHICPQKSGAHSLRGKGSLEWCDVVDFCDPEPFDIVLDSGCLHHLPKGKIAPYRQQLDEWLAPGGCFVLVHFLHRPKIKWIPRVLAI